jgi:hypothetical protein
MHRIPAALGATGRRVSFNGLIVAVLALTPVESSSQLPDPDQSPLLAHSGLSRVVAQRLPLVFDGETPPPRWAEVLPPVRPQAATRSPGRATLYSTVIPGAGQHLLGQKRKWAYLALEAAGWFFYVDRRSSGGDLKAAYRDFAWEEARIQLAPRVDGDFDYYETLTKWGQSGAFDADPGSNGIQPEEDPATFNGSIWRLATGLFLPGGPSTPPSDPQYQRALAYYQERGYGTDFLWDWNGTGTAQDEYADLISASDERYRQATNVLGAIIANHVVSAVDAFLSARGVSTPSEIRVAPVFDPSGSRWHAHVSLGVGH